MLGIHNFEAFLLACVVLNMLPGPDTFYILGRSMAQGRLIGIASALGISTGTLVHAIASALGPSALIAASATAFMAVKLIGAAYLIYLGIKMLVSGRSDAAHHAEFQGASFGDGFKQGLLTNVLNPKVAMFFLAFLPQFISMDQDSPALSFLVLGLTFVFTSTVWTLGLAWVSATVSSSLRKKPQYLIRLNRVTGVLMIGLGARLAFDK